MRRTCSWWVGCACATAMAAAVACDDKADDDTGDDGVSTDTWADPASGLEWENGDQVGTDQLTWQPAIDRCDGLEWSGHDDWRLPTISELRSLVRGCADTEEGGPCGVTATCADYDGCYEQICEGCSQYEGAAEGGIYWPADLRGAGYFYWSATAIPDVEEYAWALAFDAAYIYDEHQLNDELGVRCVR